MVHLKLAVFVKKVAIYIVNISKQIKKKNITFLLNSRSKRLSLFKCLLHSSRKKILKHKSCNVKLSKKLHLCYLSEDILKAYP